MTQRTLGTAIAVLALFLVTDAAHADIVILHDGSVLPKRVAKLVNPDEYPSNDALKRSGRGNLQLQYDTVKVGNESVDASEVKDIYCTRAVANANYENGETQARSRYFDAALPAFRSAADELKDADKQVAMWKAVLCASELRRGAIRATKTAIQEFLQAFPKGYYMPQAQNLLCRVLLNEGKPKAAKAALEAVTSAPGMNPRDYFDAAVNLIYFFRVPTARTPEQYAGVESAFRKILADIKSRRAEQKAAVPMLRAMNGIGRSLIGQRKADEAKVFFEDVLKSKQSLSDKSLLADAHKGLGDVIYVQVGREIATAKKEDRASILERLDDAALEYLQVILQYRQGARDSLQGAQQSLGQVWQWKFELTEKDDVEKLKTASRAIKMYIDAWRALPRGQAKDDLKRQVKAFQAEHDDLKDRLFPPKEAATKDK